MTYSEHELEFTFAKNPWNQSGRKGKGLCSRSPLTRNSSGDEIANVNFLYNDIVHALKIQ